MFIGPIGQAAISGMTGPHPFSDYTNGIQERYRRLKAGLDAKRGGWSDADRRRRAAALNGDDERRRRFRKLADGSRLMRHTEQKIVRDRPVPPIARPADELYSTAIHEAGHGVQAVVEGAPFAYLTVVPNQAYAGQMFGMQTHVGGNADIRLTMAGPIAKAFWNDSRWTPGTFGDGTDLKHIEENRSCDRDSLAFAELREQTERSVRENWSVIVAVADMLVEHRTVSGPDVAAIFHKHQIIAR